MVNDCKMQDHLPTLRNLHGRAACRPQKLHADKGYDFPCILESTAGLLSEPLPGSIEIQASAHERRADIYLAFFTLTAALIAFRFC